MTDKEAEFQRRLGAILFADVAGYSRLMGEDELATHDSVRQRLELFVARCRAREGQVLSERGDGVLPGGVDGLDRR